MGAWRASTCRPRWPSSSSRRRSSDGYPPRQGGTVPEVGFAELISKIAHELRSPLTSVKGFSATLVKRWDRFTDEQRLQFVETIHSDAERMGRIVSEVLDLARLEANRLEIHPVEVAVAGIARQSAEH